MIFEFLVNPVPKGRPRTGRNGVVYTDKRTREFEKEIKYLAKLQMRGVKYFEGPIKVELVFNIPRPKKSKYKYPKRADLDNYIKIIDGFNEVIWKDDSQIVEIHAVKKFSDEGLIYMRVEELSF